jgi:hypothetical protein
VEVITEERVERYRRVLCLGPDATLAQVQSAYRRGMRRAHPDLVGGDGERAKLLNEARDYLVKHPLRISRPRVAPEPPRGTPSPPVRTRTARPVEAPKVDAVEEPQGTGWRLVGGVIQTVRFVVIAYVALFVFALAGWMATVGVPWFLKVVVPIAWP